MAKQRQAKPHPVTKVASPFERHQLSPGARPMPPAPVPSNQPLARAGYASAVAIYEQGLAALQAHEYERAASLLRSVISSYPEEKELHERVRLYLNICERQIAAQPSRPSTPEERVFAATVAFNAENYDLAIEHLRAALDEDPDYDPALYMLATVLALRDGKEEAVPYLLRAIELNPENRAMARHDADLEPLRADERVRAALEAVPAVRLERRPKARRAR